MSVVHENYPQSTQAIANMFEMIAGEIVNTVGPSLKAFSEVSRSKSLITALSCAEFINRIEGLANKEIRFAGAGRQALLSSFSFVLLTIACKQIKYYPHLLTMIKQQFFKPGVFSDYDPQKRNRILNLCRNIEIQLISSGSIYLFLQTNEQFLNGFQHVLNKVIPTQTELSPDQTVQILRKKFNIDCGRLEIANSDCLCWILGMQKKVYLFEQNSYYIVVSTSTSTDPTKGMNQSSIDNRLESERSVSDIGQQVIIEASEQSTPKFKDNQQSIRYRKKSHKNSFGGDFEITGYKQLANLVNRSQVEGEQHRNNRAKRVFSLKFQMRQINGLEGESVNKQPHVDDEVPYNMVKNQTQMMRGSNIEGNQGRLRGDKRERKQKGQRKKHITSSQIFDLFHKDLTSGQRQTQVQKLEEQQNSNTNSNSNNTSGQENNKSNEEKQSKKTNDKDREKLLEGQELDQRKFMSSLSPSSGTNKQSFKFSFSKKDSKRFVFKQIQSEYNDNEAIQQTHKQFLANKNQNQAMRSSLTNFKSSNSNNLLYQGQLFKKRQNNRRSLLLQSSITPIQQQVQSSQQQKTEEHSIPQSQRERQNQLQNLEKEQQNQGLQLQKNSQSHQYQNSQSQGFNWNSGQVEVTTANGNKNYINIFKSKNRKFSYLTQPISISKNSLFGGNTELRQSYIDEANQPIPQVNQSKPKNHMPHQNHYMPKNHNRNRLGKSPKFHKNSQAITQSKPNKRRFEQNPISFSQMIANIHGQDSNFSANSHKNTHAKNPPKMSLCSNITEYSKQNAQCYNEPEGWIRKEVIYYYGDEVVMNGNKNGVNSNYNGQYLINKRRPQRYIIQRTSLTGQEDNYNIPQHNSTNNYHRYKPQQYQPQQQNVQIYANLINTNTRGEELLKNISHQPNSLGISVPLLQSPPYNHDNNNNNNNNMNNNSNLINNNVNREQINIKPNEITIQIAQTINNPINNIRSTMDTSKNTQHKASNNSYYSGKKISATTTTNNNNNNNSNTNSNVKREVSSPPSSVSNLVPSSNIESGKEIESGRTQTETTNTKMQTNTTIINNTNSNNVNTNPNPSTQYPQNSNNLLITNIPNIFTNTSNNINMNNNNNNKSLHTHPHARPNIYNLYSQTNKVTSPPSKQMLPYHNHNHNHNFNYNPKPNLNNFIPHATHSNKSPQNTSTSPSKTHKNQSNVHHQYLAYTPTPAVQPSNFSPMTPLSSNNIAPSISMTELRGLRNFMRDHRGRGENYNNNNNNNNNSNSNNQEGRSLEKDQQRNRSSTSIYSPSHSTAVTTQATINSNPNNANNNYNTSHTIQSNSSLSYSPQHYHTQRVNAMSNTDQQQQQQHGSRSPNLSHNHNHNQNHNYNGNGNNNNYKHAQLPVSAVSPRSHHYTPNTVNGMTGMVAGSASPTAVNNNNVPPLTMPYVAKGSPVPYAFGPGSSQSRHSSYREY